MAEHRVPVQTVLAFDFGLRRIGVAAGDTLTRTAAPRAAIVADAGVPDWNAVARTVGDLAPAVLVVGAPYNADGGEGAMSAAARRFAAELERRFALPVHLVDERFSSLEAAEQLRERRASGRQRRRVRREDIDSTAAAIILQRWLAGERER
ncbi:MAG: Holliday junction resolvase RuvX [Proteobacteria bacterium]|nr:Holliday junction resolvase RuvX [Pseudomonadota bacterium]